MNENAQTKTIVRRIVVTSGALLGLFYLAWILKDFESQRELLGAGRFVIGLILLAIGLVGGGASLLVYRSTRRKGLRVAARVRSMGVAMTLVTMVGFVVLALALSSDHAPMSALTLPLYMFLVGLTLGALWLRTFPVTSPTARRIVWSMLVGLAALTPLAMMVAIGTGAGAWQPILALGWLMTLVAHPMVTDEPLAVRRMPRSASAIG